MRTKYLFFYLLLAIVFATPSLMSGICKKNDSVKYIYLVRHAEKDLTDSTNNPPLTAAGEARAQKLVSEFESIQLDQIFSTPFQRNMNTVGPLAKAKNLSVETYQWNNYENLVGKIKQTNSSSILICGHSDILIPMIELFGGKSPVSEIGHNEYDKIFKIIYQPKKTKVKMWKY